VGVGYAFQKKKAAITSSCGLAKGTENMKERERMCWFGILADPVHCV